ncbi:MAG: L-fuculose phosphate aldolase [Chloroflexi bacterium ADurb.Bin120]|jgi:L-fuculose-phosphate aldolase|uniref:L-fuculose phosphate aldolase n=1 Tax=Candidatus Brevifilum fermentans TaxID=1986204 RepID=A0A1Y6K4A1_9CHLR|nr:L-fuculose-phosphate aldolase [Brevefilum fermentans]MDI9565285.1 L-fuculose-phosphate aldolase [Chloroflexota bacterium]OQB87591.1 MAG: L-fuculose phosphate aldolase [Chloroflexi bacterium ADurb.Bin120]SMX53698.1 L-fuculose phosphate aldolase [Brevefilum fermentans]HOM67323.1 L-fuculose-phosphate aldolase [Brevefilum fermentans]
MLLLDERRKVVDYAQKMLSTGLVKGTGGNISLTNEDKSLVAITPSGVAYETMRPEDVVVLDLDGNHVDGDLLPSSELGFHLALLRQRMEIKAVVHTHSDYSTALACLRWELPAVHYLIGSAGFKVPLAPYATFGTPELAEGICETIGDGNAVLLANHGLVAVGVSLSKAFSTAEMVEYVAKLYLITRSVGSPVVLNRGEMQDVLEKFTTYGVQPGKSKN